MYMCMYNHINICVFVCITGLTSWLKLIHPCPPSGWYSSWSGSGCAKVRWVSHSSRFRLDSVHMYTMHDRPEATQGAAVSA
jgi:hypothetical protein